MNRFIFADISLITRRHDESINVQEREGDMIGKKKEWQKM